MRAMIRWVAALLGLPLFSLAIIEIAVAFTALNDPEARRSTCSAMKSIGSRIPLCGLETAYPDLTQALSLLLNGIDPFQLWIPAAVASALLLWAAILL